MATVDPADDSIRRYVVRHYEFDPERHERRHRVVAAFDNLKEYEATIEAHRQSLDDRRALGESVHPLEYYSGVVLEPGHKRRANAGRLLRTAIAHKVPLSEATLRSLDLPPNVAVFSTRKVGRVRGLRMLFAVRRARHSSE